MKQTVICLKWEDRYGPEYVNKLHSMVRRNTRRPLRFICFTDDPTGIDPAIEIKRMPPFTLPEVMRKHPFRRMFIFQNPLEDVEGHVLHFDLDVLITGNIDDFFDYKPTSTFCVAENWTQPGQGIGNMSVFRFRAGSHPYIYERFMSDPLGQKRKYRNSQTFVCRNISELDFFPRNWCLSFKHSLLPRWPMNFFLTPKLPPDAKVVAFTGRPDIDEAAMGRWETTWWKRSYKYVRPTPWILEHWR